MELPNLGGQTRALAINNSGVIVGWSIDSGGFQRAFRYQNGIMTDLGSLGGNDSQALGVNDNGVVVGLSFLGDPATSQYHAFLHNGAMVDIHWPGQLYASLASGINDGGVVVGQTRHNDNAYSHAFTYSNGVYTDLGTLNNGADPQGSTAVGASYGRAINSFGHVVGSSTGIPGNPRQHAFVYVNGQMTDLGTLGGDPLNGSDAYDINDAGIAVGSSEFGQGGTRPVMFLNGTVIEVGAGAQGYAYGINNQSEVVGEYAPTGAGARAFYYMNGVVTNLHTYFPPQWLDSSATAINDMGWIVGHGAKDNGNGTSTRKAWVLIPIPTSSTFLSIGDTYLKEGQPNKNQGTEGILRIRQSGQNRSLVQFDQNAISSFVGTRSVTSATLRFYISLNSNNWGASGRDVGVHRLTSSWTELGATWNCPDDTNTGNNSPDGVQWEMNNVSLWPFVSTASDIVVHTNGLVGWIEFDVTADVQGFLSGNPNYGWLIKKTNEGQSGSVEYSSKDGANPPELIITAQ